MFLIIWVNWPFNPVMVSSLKAETFTKIDLLSHRDESQLLLLLLRANQQLIMLIDWHLYSLSEFSAASILFSFPSVHHQNLHLLKHVCDVTSSSCGFVSLSRRPSCRGRWAARGCGSCLSPRCVRSGSSRPGWCEPGPGWTWSDEDSESKKQKPKRQTEFWRLQIRQEVQI